MPDTVVFDTNILPVGAGLDGTLWLTIRKLCNARGIRIVLPDLVVAESVNLRRSKYRESAQSFLVAFRTLSKLYEPEPVYVPDEAEIASAWEQELRDAFEVVELDGEDATQALGREARRVRPARAGKGGRDSAIWLTVLRLASPGNRVWFVSRNTADFGGGKAARLHPDLAADVDGVEGDVTYFASVDDFIAEIAESMPSRVFDPSAVADLVRFDLRDQIARIVVSDSAYTDDLADALNSDGLSLESIANLRAYSVHGNGLALCKARGSIAVGPVGDGAEFSFDLMCWVEFDPEDGIPASGEVSAVQIVAFEGV